LQGGSAISALGMGESGLQSMQIWQKRYRHSPNLRADRSLRASSVAANLRISASFERIEIKLQKPC
jgi:hypothetical protein